MKKRLLKTSTLIFVFIMLFSATISAENNDNDVIQVSSLIELRSQEADGTTVYVLLNEVILTYQEDFRNSKYIQDETAGILIDDNPGVITTKYNIYDGITGIEGTLSEFNDMMQFVPVADPGPATSTGNVVEPVVLTMEDYIDNFMLYQARLVTIENVYFLVDAETNFANGQIYEFTDDEFVAEFRTTFFNVNYIGDPIPTGNMDITGLPNSRAEGDFLTARNWGDILTDATYNVTFEFIDEAGNAVDAVSLDFMGETINEAPYHFTDVSQGRHPYMVSKEGYHPNQGEVFVWDGDVTKEIVMVAVDPNMITEFPWSEHFDDGVFPPQGWSHYALGDAGSWELQNEQAYHNYTSQGQVADSWLITQQIQIPEDEILLLNFLERNQYMAEYGYSGVLISTGSGNPEHGHFTEIYESSGNIGIEDPKETLLNLASYAGKVVYIAFNYQGEFAHRWWVYDLMIDFAPEAIEVPNIATLLEQSVSPDLVYRITGEVIITHLQTPYRGQFYIQDETGATMIDDPAGVVVTEFDLYDGITGFTGNLGEFQSMFQFVPTEDPGQPSSTGNEIEPLELTLSELTIDKQGMLVLVRNVHFDEENPTEWTHNVSYFIYDDTGEGEIRTPNSPGLLDYFGEPVPATPKDIIGVLHQRHAVTRLLPRMLADFMDPEPVQVISPGMHEMVIFPNPASTHVTIDNGDNNIDKIRIYNLSGQIVKTVNVSSTSVQINITDIQPGMYIVQMVSGSEVKSMKLSIYR